MIVQINGHSQKLKWDEIDEERMEPIEIIEIKKYDWNQLNEIEGEDLIIKGQKNPKLSNWNDINDIIEENQLFIENTYKHPQNWNDINDMEGNQLCIESFDYLIY